MPKRGRRSTLQFSNNHRLVRESRTSERHHFIEKYEGPNKAPYATELVSIPEQPVFTKPAVLSEKLSMPNVKIEKKGYNIQAFAPFGNDFTLPKGDQFVKNRIEMFRK